MNSPRSKAEFNEHKRTTNNADSIDITALLFPYCLTKQESASTWHDSFSEDRQTRMKIVSTVKPFHSVNVTLMLLNYVLFEATSAAYAEITTTRIATGLNAPVFADTPPSDLERLFVAEQTGSVKIVNLADGSINARPFLTIDEQINGLYGLAFHPDYDNNGLVYVNYVNTAGMVVLLEYRVSANDPDVVDPLSKKTILSYQRHDEGASGHKGGWIDFSPVDNYLYISTGDGGKASYHDKDNRSQDITDQFLGKILRIDVNSGDQFPNDSNRNYAIPPSNPFVNLTGDDEIWAYGLRNPWRPSFDRQSGDLYIADVGQDTLEELDFQPASAAGGTNYGWRLREGTIATPTGSYGGPKPPGAIDPFYEYRHGQDTDEGFSVTGGFVYRGPIASLQGKYFFADYVTNRIWSVVHDGSDPTSHTGDNVSEFIDWTDVFAPTEGSMESIASFGEDAVGNLYLLSLNGDIFRVAANGDFDSNGVVDGHDFLKWQREDRTVYDLGEWEANYGSTAAAEAGAKIPEPNTLQLFPLFWTAFLLIRSAAVRNAALDAHSAVLTSMPAMVMAAAPQRASRPTQSTISIY